MAYLGMPSPDQYRTAIRSGVAITYRVSASLGGQPVAGAQDLAPTGGSITDSASKGARRLLNLQLAPAPGLFDRLSPIGTTLAVTARVRLTSQQTVDIPMGVFDVDSQRLSEGPGGSLSLTAPDKWVRLQRARFIGPFTTAKDLTVVTQIVQLIQGALGSGEPVTVTATSLAKVGLLTEEKDRAGFIEKLADSIGAWVFFDRLGVATIANRPSYGVSADWLVDASASGVLTELDRDRSRTETRNVVVVSSSASDGEKFPTQYVWDNRPSSPTYAGTNPRSNPGSAGPFGVVPLYYDTPLPLDAAGARAAGRTILARVTGLASQVSLGQVPNPAVDAGDVLDVLPPGRATTMVTGYVGGAGFGTTPLGDGPFGEGSPGRPIVQQVTRGAVMERHMADTVTHPLTLGAAQTIEGRSTAYEPIEGTS